MLLVLVEVGPVHLVMRVQTVINIVAIVQIASGGRVDLSNVLLQIVRLVVLLQTHVETYAREIVGPATEMDIATKQATVPKISFVLDTNARKIPSAVIKPAKLQIYMADVWILK